VVGLAVQLSTQHAAAQLNVAALGDTLIPSVPQAEALVGFLAALKGVPLGQSNVATLVGVVVDVATVAESSFHPAFFLQSEKRYRVSRVERPRLRRQLL